MVDGAHINNVLAHPKDIAVNHLAALEETLREFPYFQAARSIYLKGLKSESSSLYNKELQKTAAHTTDRSVLFDFITSESFSQNKVSEQIKLLQQQENKIEIEVEKPEEGITPRKKISMPIKILPRLPIWIFLKRKKRALYLMSH
jgi:hypothetical protein